MADKTKISWHHYTMNLSHGCTKQSPACEHCYAESYDKRKLLDSEPTGVQPHHDRSLTWRRSAKRRLGGAARPRRLVSDDQRKVCRSRGALPDVP